MHADIKIFQNNLKKTVRRVILSLNGTFYLIFYKKIQVSNCICIF